MKFGVRVTGRFPTTGYRETLRQSVSSGRGDRLPVRLEPSDRAKHICRRSGRDDRTGLRVTRVILPDVQPGARERVQYSGRESGVSVAIRQYPGPVAGTKSSE